MDEWCFTALPEHPDLAPERGLLPRDGDELQRTVSEVVVALELHLPELEEDALELLARDMVVAEDLHALRIDHLTEDVEAVTQQVGAGPRAQSHRRLAEHLLGRFA